MSKWLELIGRLRELGWSESDSRALARMMLREEIMAKETVH